MNYSVTWKDKLIAESASMKHVLERHFGRKRYRSADDDLFILLEHFIFTTACITRKLKDAERLSDEFEDEAKIKVRLLSRRKRGRSVQDNWFDKAGIQSRPRTEMAAAWKVCGLLIHALEFMTWEWRDRQTFVILFTSDYTRAKCIHEITLTDWMAFVEAVAADEVGYFAQQWDDRLQDRVTTEKPRRGSPRDLAHKAGYNRTMKKANMPDNVLSPKATAHRIAH